MDNCRIVFISELSNYLYSFGDALEQQGHELHYQTSWDQDAITACVERLRPDMMITVGCREAGVQALPDYLPELCRKYRMLHLYWATEDKIHFERISLPAVRRMRPDLVLTIHPDCIASYRQHGFRAVYMNFALNPRMFPAKTDLTRERFDLSFVGTTHLETYTYRYDSLRQLVFPLIKAGKRIDVWGRNWQRYKDQIAQQFGTSIPPEWDHGHLSFEHTADIYHQSKIMLGVQNAEDQVTQRTFEILGTGAFMIASRTEELERLFEHGEELILSSSPEETLALVDYYLQRPDERMRIGRNARKKVLQQHTFAHRLAEVWPAVQALNQSKKENFA